MKIAFFAQRVEVALDDGKMSFVLAGGEPQVYVKF